MVGVGVLLCSCCLLLCENSLAEPSHVLGTSVARHVVARNEVVVAGVWLACVAVRGPFFH